MPYLQAKGLQLGFGGPPLLDGVELTLDGQERVALVGRNGAGKSTLMRVLAQEQNLEGGRVLLEEHRRLAYVRQSMAEEITGTVENVIAEAFESERKLLERYDALAASLGDTANEGALAEFEKLQEDIDRTDAWSIEQRIVAQLDSLRLNGEDRFEELSGGMKRRVLLGRALVQRPDILLLDEPTNHLDLNAIDWLESALLEFKGALLFVTHDRMFLRRLCTRIVDLDRGKLVSYPGDFEVYQERKAKDVEDEIASWKQFDKKLAEEEAWIRQGIKARRTRNEGRVRALKKLRMERRARREHVGRAQFSLQGAEKSGKNVLEAKGLGFRWPDKAVVEDFDCLIKRGDRVGILGANGSGKTTLVRLLLGELEPQVGTVREGTRLEVLYSDQLRESIDLEKSVRDNISDGHDSVVIGENSRHVLGYLQDFLFTPAQARGPARILSGGERNRLALAKLFTHPANLLVLDEPTNDLDAETLELLESLLLEFTGTILLVSHDRELLNNVATKTIAFDHDGVVRLYVGGYDDWVQQRPPLMQEAKKKKPKQEKKKEHASARKLSFKEKDELKTLPARIEDLEGEQASINETLGLPETYQKDDGTLVTQLNDRLGAIDRELGELYARWEELEGVADLSS